MIDHDDAPVSIYSEYHEDGSLTDQFYLDLFGWSSNDLNLGGRGRYTFFNQRGAATAGIARIDVQELGLPQWAVYVNVEDVDERAARAVQLGGSILMPPTDVPGHGRTCMVLDPRGAAFYLFTPE